MSNRRRLPAIVPLATVWLLWGCSSGGGVGGVGGADKLANDPGVVNDNTAEFPDPGGGGGGGHQDGGDDPVTTGRPGEEETGSYGIDCSGQPYEETGVNLTPYYKEIPAYSLPEDILGELRPESLDLSDELPPPCHQGLLRSCVAWQVGYGMMSYFAATRLDDWGRPDRPDRQFSPTFLFNQANAYQLGRSRATSCARSAAFIGDVMGFVQQNGCALMSDVPHYNDGVCDELHATVPLDEVDQRAEQYKIAYYRKIDHDAETMKTYLLQELPPLVVFLVDSVFERLSGSQAYDTVEAEGSPHAVLVIGYDDRRQAFKIHNSWGTSWGDRGYGWVSCDIWPEVVAEAWIAAPAFNDAGGDLVAGYDPAANPGTLAHIRLTSSAAARQLTEFEVARCPLGNASSFDGCSSAAVLPNGRWWSASGTTWPWWRSAVSNWRPVQPCC